MRIVPSLRARLIAVVAGVLAAVGLLVALNWSQLTTKPAVSEPVGIFVASGITHGRVLTLFADSCRTHAKVSVEETNEAVRVLLTAERLPEEECLPGWTEVPITLHDKLRDRLVIDASRDAVIEVVHPDQAPWEG